MYACMYVAKKSCNFGSSWYCRSVDHVYKTEITQKASSDKLKSCWKNIVPERFENLAGQAFLREAGEHHQMCRHHHRSGCRICLASNRLQPFGCSSWSWFEGDPGVALDSRGRGTSSQAPENKRLGQLMPSSRLVVGISGKAYGCFCYLQSSQKRQTFCQSQLLLMRQSFESLTGDPVSRRGWKVVLQTLSLYITAVTEIEIYGNM